jgi:two-component system sensor histidine kinase/response regulator
MERSVTVVAQRILAVEDSRTQAERLRLLLTAAGYEVEVALTGKQGLRSATARHPQLIISDVTMPEMDGFAFCQAVKSSESTRHIPFILLTARASPADIIRGLECGADNFIPKPYEDDYLLARVRRIVEQLELRNRDRLEMEVVLTLRNRRVVVTADRQQIMELLFATFEEVSKSHDKLARANRELEHARADADRANHAKSEFLSHMSHELRTPLNAILGFAQLLELDDLRPDHRESTQRILQAGRHLLELINELLDIARIEEGRLALTLEPVVLAEVVREAVELVIPLADGRGIVLETEGFGWSGHVLTDRQRLTQVLLNLLSNAIKYNRDGGTVTVSCIPESDDQVTVRVRDTGLGIPHAMMDRLFEPFERLGAEQTAIQGTGLGLALSKRLVELMGGSITADSTPGQGTAFQVTLGIAQQPSGRYDHGATTTPAGKLPVHDAAEALPGLPRPQARGGRVLIADDNITDRELAVAMLQRMGYAADVVASGAQALQAMRSVAYDAVLMDCQMPQMDGYQATAEIRKRESSSRRTPIIAMTINFIADDREKCLQAGMDDYLSKPVSFEELGRMLGRWVAGGEQR